MDDSGLYNTPLNRTVRAIKKSMSQYGITRPLTIEYKSNLNNLPKTPERRKGVQNAVNPKTISRF